jgi:hypothetical protein
MVVIVRSMTDLLETARVVEIKVVSNRVFDGKWSKRSATLSGLCTRHGRNRRHDDSSVS